MIYLLLILLTSCSSNEQDAASLMLSLTHELQLITTKEDLIKKQGVIKEIFYDIAGVMIAQQPPSQSLEELEEMNWSLREEMVRIYQIDGARELMESYQKNALNLLAEHGIHAQNSLCGQQIPPRASAH